MRRTCTMFLAIGLLASTSSAQWLNYITGTFDTLQHWDGAAVVTSANPTQVTRGSFTYNVIYTTNSIQLVLDTACPGDIDGNLAVNAVDLGRLLASFNAAVPVDTLGDLNSDAMVDVADLNILLPLYGDTCP